MLNKTYRIYSRRIALELRRKGFKIVGTDINENFPQYDVYLFEDTEQLREELTKLSKK